MQYNCIASCCLLLVTTACCYCHCGTRNAELPRASEQRAAARCVLYDDPLHGVVLHNKHKPWA
jgi:hypothetical protein